MFQQNIEVSHPHMKPVVFKCEELPPDSTDTVMPLEYFSAYELELQETILQLNSELEGNSDSSYSEDDDQNDADHAETSVSLSDRLSSSEDSVWEACEGEDGQVQSLEAPTSQQASPGVLPTKAFDDYESLLQKAVHELTSLSDVLVGMVCRTCINCADTAIIIMFMLKELYCH